MLTKEELLAPAPVPEEPFELPRRGTVMLRGITDVRAFDRMNQEIRKTSIAADRGFPPYAGYSKEEITRAHWLAAGLSDPEIDVLDGLKMGRQLGPVVESILLRIADLSGISLGAMEEKESELREDTFPAADPAPVPDAPAPSPVGSQREPAGAGGDRRV